MKNKGSYIKLAIKTAVGAVLGGILGLVVLGTKVAHMGKEMKGLESWIGAQAHWIFLLLFLIELAAVVWSYNKVKALRKQHQSEEDDEQIEKIEYGIEYYNTLFTVFAMVSFILAMIFYGVFAGVPKGEIPRGFWMATIMFILICIVYAVAHIKMVRLIQSIYPEKMGDPSDLNFDEVWLQSCDEAEREVIYQSAYKTYRGSQWVLAVLMVVALMGEITWQTGVLAIVLIGILWGTMGIMYCYYSLKLQKGKISKE